MCRSGRYAFLAGTGITRRENGLNRRRSLQGPFMRRRAIRIALVIVAFGAAAAIAIGDIAHRAAARRLREAILAELQPVVLKNCTLKRFGSPRRAAGVDSSDHDGDARLRRSEDCRGAPEAEAEFLSCEPPLQ